MTVRGMNSRRRFRSTTRSRSSSAPKAIRDDVNDERSGRRLVDVVAGAGAVTAVIREALSR